ncbi:MAG: alpha/beta hydrolase [Pseudomonadales bacterium]
MPLAAANDIEIYYERGGAGPPLLFISGTGGDLRNRPNPFDSALAGAFELLCYDQRGLGRTSKPPGPYTMADYADDAAALLDGLGIDRLPVMGVSFGGMVAQEFALRHADRVQALVLACTSSGGVGGASYPLHELEDLAPAQRAEAHLRVADLRHTDDWIAAHPEAWRRRLELALAAQRADRDEAGASAQLEARRGHDTADRLAHLRMPVLLIGGEHDGIAPAANMRALHARIAGSELRFFDGGHLFLIQDRESYPYIIQWLKTTISS